MRYLTLTLLVLAGSVTSAIAGDPSCGDKCGHGCLLCPRCHEPCFPTVTKESETRHCWEVETKTICIPKVRFPWQNDGCGKGGKGCWCDCLQPHCGRSKCVHVLLKCEYECAVCKYKWEYDGGKGKCCDPPVAPEGVHEGAPENEVPPPPPVHTTYVPAGFEGARPATVEVRRVSSSDVNPYIIGR